MSPLFKKSAILLLLVYIHFSTEAQTKDSLAVKQVVDTFIQNFNTLQWEGFRSAFIDDATIFFPDWEDVRRRSGRQEIEKTWLEIFPEFKDSTNTLQLGIKPRDVLIQLYDRTAIVTFHLGSGEKGLARRTIVMVKEKKKWKIAHLHASYVTLLQE